MSPSTEPQSAVERLLVALEAGRPVPPEVAAWFIQSYRTWRRGGPGLSLCRAAGLVKLTRADFQERDRHLVAAAVLVTSNGFVSISDRASRLGHAIESFERHLAPELGERVINPDHRLSPLDAAIYRAKEAAQWRPLPTSSKQLARILKQKWT